MSRRLNVHLLPEFSQADFVGGTAVIVDVLRASTTIIYALAAGVREVVPCLEVEDAQKAAEELTAAGQDVLLGGERGGVKIEGFDLGNSPAEYTPAAVGGKTLVFTTTNGTKAMYFARGAEEILIGAPANRAAVAERLTQAVHVHIICAGTEQEITLEDVLYAGWLTEACLAHDINLELCDSAQLALAAFRHLIRAQLPAEAALAEIEEVVRGAFLHSQGGKNLVAVGLEEDIRTAARTDVHEIVPQLAVKPWRIRIAT